MPNLNKVIMMGRFTRTPELRTTPAGTPVIEVTLAVNRKVKMKDGQPQEDEVCYIDTVIWGKTAQALSNVDKGFCVLVDGYLRLDKWEKDGEKRSKHKLIAMNVQFISSLGERADTVNNDDAGAPDTEQHLPF
ncbi:MAG TPA: single-stranded DNA-binding protein [Armatimonadota bacterium]|nr:single-stranded DNA-binding protein [Armatimonadota bacterium]